MGSQVWYKIIVSVCMIERGEMLNGKWAAFSKIVFHHGKRLQAFHEEAEKYKGISFSNKYLMFTCSRSQRFSEGILFLQT